MSYCLFVVFSFVSSPPDKLLIGEYISIRPFLPTVLNCFKRRPVFLHPRLKQLAEELDKARRLFL